MPRGKRTTQHNDPEENLEAQSQTADVSEEKPFDPTRSKEEGKTYDEAQDINREHDFVKAILKAREPPPVPEHTPPQVPPAIVEQTRLEMEAGRKRMMEFAGEEVARQEAHERHKRDKWADKESTPVFRPDDYVPDQKKGQGNITATSAPLKE
jgi:hypothetical protein